MQVSISSTFYLGLFHTKVFCVALISPLAVWLCNLLVKEDWRKIAHKMLIKLTTGGRVCETLKVENIN